MCGRYTLRADRGRLIEAFDTFDWPIAMPPRYNVAPTQEVPVVSNTGDGRVETYRWGLIPSWADDAAIGNRMINARAETLAEKPAFRRPLRRQRCLVFADGFYEWRPEPGGKHKTPFYIRMRSDAPFAFAGLWEEWTDPDDKAVRSCTIITTEPNELLRGIHNRMPVILPPSAFGTWLAPYEQQPKALTPLLRSYPPDEMEAFAVSQHVNNPSYDSPDCIAPAP